MTTEIEKMEKKKQEGELTGEVIDLVKSQIRNLKSETMNRATDSISGHRFISNRFFVYSQKLGGFFEISVKKV